jgi:hypothetical protein
VGGLLVLASVGNTRAGAVDGAAAECKLAVLWLAVAAAAAAAAEEDADPDAVPFLYKKNQ